MLTSRSSGIASDAESDAGEATPARASSPRARNAMRGACASTSRYCLSRAKAHTVTAFVPYGCSPCSIQLQRVSHTVTALAVLPVERQGPGFDGEGHGEAGARHPRQHGGLHRERNVNRLEELREHVRAISRFEQLVVHAGHLAEPAHQRADGGAAVPRKLYLHG